MSTRSLVLFLTVFLAFLLVPFFSLKAPVFVHVAQSISREPEIVEVIKVWITAYSSSIDETDDTPLITASNTGVRDGIVAANFLPFGTLIKIPSVFGDKVFVVEDRMHWRKNWVVDVWMPSKQKALNFGAYLTDIQVVQRPS